MNKKRFFVIMLVCMLAFSLIPSYETSADEFASTGERDTWLLGVLKDYPYYFVATGGTLEAAFLATASILSISGKDTMWQYENQSDYKPPFMQMGFVFADGRYAQGGCSFYFTKDKNAADTVFIPNLARAGCSVFGPFFSGSTDATRRAALKRIIDGTTSYRATRNEKNPWS
jgi:hypothetical protein